MKERIIRNIVKASVWAVAAALVFFVILSNAAPWGAATVYDNRVDGGISDLSPPKRYRLIKQDIGYIPEQREDLTYFTTDMPFRYDKAKVRITFRNPYEDQVIKVGFKDKDIWHYDTKVIDAPILDGLTWEHVGKDPTLYQKEKHYENVPSFLSGIPEKSVIGTFDYDLNYLKLYESELPDYTPASSDTVIDTPLRGKQIIYMYLDQEPFRLHLEKQDLNWYEDPDTTIVKVFKGTEMVYQVTVDDDGVADDSKTPGVVQSVDIANPGPELPEKGAYKVVIEANADTIIKKLQTNLHKIVFEGTVFPVDNAQVLPKIVKETRPTELVTKGRNVKIRTYHDQALQQVRVGEEEIDLDMVQEERVATLSGELTQITLPKSDVILSTPDYFAFSQDQYFEPTPFKVIDITDSEQIDQVDYLITNFTPPLNTEGMWQVAEKEFDLKMASIEKGKLSWLVQMPGIKDRPMGVYIKKIEVELYKDPWNI